MQTQRKLFLALGLAGLFGLGGGMLLSRGIADNPAPVVFPKELVSYSSVVKRVLPAVVSVRVVQAKTTQVRGERQPRELPQFEGPEQLREFMEEMMQQQPGEMPARPGQFGSGAIIDPKGIVVTNNHVVAGAAAVQVNLTDGRSFTSKKIFTDPKTDLAVIKLETRETLPFLEIGDSEAMEIGDRVLAVGAPFGLEGSVTHGIVSGKGRSAGMLLYEDFIQTDAAINPGNSGGPVVNLEGRIIGISTMIRTSNGGSQGVGLAIPARIVKDVTKQLIATGNVQRGYLGIRFGEVTPEVAQKLGLSSKGAMISQVYPDTPASKGGLQEGDIIIGVNGEPLKDSKNIQRLVSQTEIGGEIKFDLLRNGEKVAAKVVIEAQPAEYGLRDVPVRGPGRRLPNRNAEQAEAIRVESFGLEVTPLTAESKERLGYAKNQQGVMISNVDRTGPAFQQGLRRGMVIVAVDNKPVSSPEDFDKLAEKASLKEGVLLQIKTPQGTEFLVLKQGE